jgi:hypothetical protein
MSAVRMCDTCSRIFSENEDGWATAPVQKMKRNAIGTMVPTTEQRDSCPDCNRGQPVNLRPHAETYAGELPNAAKIRELEREAGITDPA